MQEHDHAQSRDAIVDVAREILQEQGDQLSWARFREETGIPDDIIQTLFGGWPGLLLEASRPEGACRWSDKPTEKELIARLRQLGQERGNSVTQEQFAKYAGVSVSFIYRHFGSWRNLRAAAGMWRKAMPPKLYTNRELLDDMLRIYLTRDQKSSYWTHSAVAGKFSANAIRRRYGSWEEAKIVFSCYMQEYFLARDPNWTLSEHERTFKPDFANRVEWPADKDGLDWSPDVGWHPVNDPRQQKT